MTIKLIATDLDGTLFQGNRTLSNENKRALKDAMAKGIEVVVATGRALVTIPDEVRYFDGFNYIVTSNGANVIDAKTEKAIHTHHISPAGMDSIWNYLLDPDQMVELFLRGKAYVSRKCWDGVESYGTPARFAEYVRATRTPVDNFLGFLEDHKGEIENINLVFPNQEKRLKTWGELLNYPLVNVTSSLTHNVEIGPLGVSKAQAIEEICNDLGIAREETMCIGDNSTELTMIEFAGTGVAMGNAVEEVKAAADFITKDNDEDGVAYAIDKFI